MYVIRRCNDGAFLTRDNTWSVPVIKRSTKPTPSPIGWGSTSTVGLVGWVDTSDLARFTLKESDWIVLDSLYKGEDLEAIKLADIKWEELDGDCPWTS